MTASGPTELSSQPWQLEATGPATLAEIMEQEEKRAASGEATRLRPLPTGFEPLDEVLNGGLRPGELLVIGGPFGVGKTIWGLQVARNAVYADENAIALYVCYEHDREHLLQRLLCLESAMVGGRGEAVTLVALAKMALESGGGQGLISRLKRLTRYAPAVAAVERYAGRMVLVKASGDMTTLDQIRHWVEEVKTSGPERMVVVVDYLQKIPVNWSQLEPETEVTTFLAQGLKEMALALGLPVIAIAASDRSGLKSKRMRLTDMRGSSAVQYEADIGLILNNKWAIVSREHLVYNPAQAEAMRNYVVLSVEKNRSGRNAVDMEYLLDAAHFRIVPKGDFVRERLIDDKVVLA
jgi:replicative DNA helicase